MLSGLPLINISGYSSIGATNSDPRGRVDDNYQLFGNVSHTLGNHAFKYGYEFRRTFIKSFFDAGYRGKLSFPDPASFLAGIPDGGFSAGGGSVRHTFENNSGLYFQDSWRVTNRFTFNYGIRRDYYGVLGESDGQSVPRRRRTSQHSTWSKVQLLAGRELQRPLAVAGGLELHGRVDVSFNPDHMHGG